MDSLISVRVCNHARRRNRALLAKTPTIVALRSIHCKSIYQYIWPPPHTYDVSLASTRLGFGLQRRSHLLLWATIRDLFWHLTMYSGKSILQHFSPLTYVALRCKSMRLCDQIIIVLLSLIGGGALLTTAPCVDIPITSRSCHDDAYLWPLSKEPNSYVLSFGSCTLRYYRWLRRYPEYYYIFQCWQDNKWAILSNHFAPTDSMTTFEEEDIDCAYFSSREWGFRFSSVQSNAD